MTVNEQAEHLDPLKEDQNSQRVSEENYWDNTPQKTGNPPKEGTDNSTKKKRKFGLKQRLDALLGLNAVNTALLIGALFWAKGNSDRNASQEANAGKTPIVAAQSATASAAEKEIEGLRNFIQTNDATNIQIESKDGVVMTTERHGDAYCVTTHHDDGTLEVIRDGAEEWVFMYDSDGNLSSRKYSNGKAYYLQTLDVGYGRMATDGPTLNEYQANELVKAGLFSPKAFPQIAQKASDAYNKARAQQKKQEDLEEMRNREIDQGLGI